MRNATVPGFSHRWHAFQLLKLCGATPDVFVDVPKGVGVRLNLFQLNAQPPSVFVEIIFTPS